MKKISVILIITFLLSLAGSCSKKEKISIAIKTSLEARSIEGLSVVNAAKLFLEDYKCDNIEIIFFDDGCRSKKTVEAYEEVKKSGIKILITTHISTCAIAIYDQLNRDGVLTFSTAATTDKLSRMDDYIFRNIQDVGKEQKRIAEYINTNGFNRLLIIRDTDNSDYTDPAIKYFREGLRSREVAVIDISIAKVDHGDLLLKMKRYNFSSLYLLMGSNASGVGAIAQLASSIRPGMRIMYTPWVKSPLILETAGSSIRHSVIPSHYPPKNVNARKDAYISRFKERFGSSQIFIGLNVYSALEILYQCISAGEKDPDAIKKYILNKKTFQTEFGTLTFDEFGDVDRPLYFITEISKEF
ncbi:MAG TPA: ABC transporter substrate-binding protein [Spirochaetota bacterium]|nr:ABC transporter substrate-binding protein [Spirochaetota bacterium]